MLLYQLAMELDERSPDVAERAEALGLGTVGPTSDLTTEQVQTLRAAYRKPDSGPVEGPVTVIGPSKPAPTEPEEPSAPSGRGRKVAVVLGCVLALVGAVAFFVVQASPAEERRERMSHELAAWDKAPAATVAPEVEAAVTFPGDQPRDKGKLCAAAKAAVSEEGTRPETTEDQLDFTDLRRWAADRSAWQAAMDEVAKTGPTDAVPDITDYRSVQEQYYRRLAQASDSELRALAEGVELNELEGYGKAIDDAREDMDAYLTPICGALGG